MIFTSTKREDVNNHTAEHRHDDVLGTYLFEHDTVRPEDPEPWVEPGEDDNSYFGPFTGTRHSEAPGPDDIGYFEPRPGYRAPANRILVELREAYTWDTVGLFGYGRLEFEIEALLRPNYYPDRLPEEIEHARKVLTRLASLDKAVSK